MKSPGFLWLTYPSEKYEFVSWDDYSHILENKKRLETTNQEITVLGFDSTVFVQSLLGESRL
jgi:hypothetical protein